MKIEEQYKIFKSMKETVEKLEKSLADKTTDAIISDITDSNNSASVNKNPGLAGASKVMTKSKEQKGVHKPYMEQGQSFAGEMAREGKNKPHTAHKDMSRKLHEQKLGELKQIKPNLPKSEEMNKAENSYTMHDSGKGIVHVYPAEKKNKGSRQFANKDHAHKYIEIHRKDPSAAEKYHQSLPKPEVKFDKSEEMVKSYKSNMHTVEYSKAEDLNKTGEAFKGNQKYHTANVTQSHNPKGINKPAMGLKSISEKGDHARAGEHKEAKETHKKVISEMKEIKPNLPKSEGSITIKPHPKPVIDVDPKIIGNMKNTIKESNKTKDAPREKVRDMMDDSSHTQVKKSNDAVGKKISKLVHEGEPQKQAVATALNMERAGRLTASGDYKHVKKSSKLKKFMAKKEEKRSK